MNKILKYTSGFFVIIISLMGLVYAAGNLTTVGQLANDGDFVMKDWFNEVSTTLGGSKFDGKMCTFNGGKISCVNDVPVNNFGLLQEGKWCTVKSGKIECTQSAPSSGGAVAPILVGDVLVQASSTNASTSGTFNISSQSCMAQDATAVMVRGYAETHKQAGESYVKIKSTGSSSYSTLAYVSAGGTDRAQTNSDNNTITIPLDNGSFEYILKKADNSQYSGAKLYIVGYYGTPTGIDCSGGGGGGGSSSSSGGGGGGGSSSSSSSGGGGWYDAIP